MRIVAAILLLSLVTACGWLPVTEEPAASGPFAPDSDAPRLEAVPTRHYDSVGSDQELLGALQVVFARHENTLVDFARHYNLGLDELRLANPGVDTWLPGEGTPIFLPTESVIPDVPREGLVLNLPSMRLLYFMPATGQGGERGETAWSVASHPVGIGREGWETPVGEATVTSKAREPTWYPPASVRAEHAEMGDPLPGVVPPGPDNPLGGHVLGLSLPGYLIHGTNKPPGVGMRVSHGCVRLYPEDIEALYGQVPIGTPVRIIDQPALAGWRDGELYLEVHPPLSEDTRDLGEEARGAIAAALQRAGRPDAAVDATVVAHIVEQRNGIPYPILAGEPAPERYLAAARVVRNDLPAEADAVAPGL
ncbi:MAG: L,D-transpeptidase family protein [Lysobacterales bacterium]